MKYSSIFISVTLSFAVTYSSIAQKSKAVCGEVIYDFIHSLDSIHSYVDSTADITQGKLLFTKTKSKFTSKPLSKERQSPLNETITGYSVRISGTDTLGNIQFSDQLTDSIYSREVHWNKETILSEKIPQIPWIVTKEYKQIKGIKCQRADGVFRGRTYTAWFAETIPVSAGPWKLNGLPGLIVEAYDSTRQVQFLLKELTYPSYKFTDQQITPGIDISKSLSWQDVEKQKIKIENNFKATAEGILPEGASITMSFTVQNPIERAY